MEKQAIIKVEDVSMKFNLSSEKFDSFKEYVIKRLKKQVKFDEFWALKNVSFEVYKGESDGRINNTKMHGESITQNNRRKEHERS